AAGETNEREVPCGKVFSEARRKRSCLYGFPPGARIEPMCDPATHRSRSPWADRKVITRDVRVAAYVAETGRYDPEISVCTFRCSERQTERATLVKHLCRGEMRFAFEQ